MAVAPEYTEPNVDIPREQNRKRRRWALLAACAVVVATVSVALVGIDPAVPTVDRAVVWTDSVRLSDMTREVGGTGTLVPERARWVVAMSGGRIDRIEVEPGQTVTADQILVDLSNPDVQVEGLNAERELAAAQAEQATLATTLQTQVLDQEASIATLRTQQREAARQLEAYRELASRGLLSRNELAAAEDKASELETRLRLDEQRLQLMRESAERRMVAQTEQLRRLNAIASFQRERAATMQVRAGADGVVQDLRLEVGQWVMPGQTLARVAEPDRLIAELHIPETQARDVAPGQHARIDTRNGVVGGTVRRVDPSVVNGTVKVEVALDETPAGARPDLSVEGTIEVERLGTVPNVARPAGAPANALVGLWKLDGDGGAVRVPVRLGRASVNRVEIVDGLAVGDSIILTDVRVPSDAERIRIR